MGKSIKLAQDVLPYEANNETHSVEPRVRICLGAMSSEFYLDEL
jgi:hypothetical protein